MDTFSGPQNTLSLSQILFNALSIVHKYTYMYVYNYTSQPKVNAEWKDYLGKYCVLQCHFLREEIRQMIPVVETPI